MCTYAQYDPRTLTHSRAVAASLYRARPEDTVACAAARTLSATERTSSVPEETLPLPSPSPLLSPEEASVAPVAHPSVVAGRGRRSRRRHRRDPLCYRAHSQRSGGDAVASVAQPSAVFRRHRRRQRRDQFSNQPAETECSAVSTSQKHENNNGKGKENESFKKWKHGTVR